ncbi:putative BOI-related E3 ubiquitin-protein ligase 3 [Cinnamomum micranthum f. kanehirae]|uniref:Putative BOI-related E3 ubiquitin-protein ligase 3 n=1 Tax=Cinnamomum micranthum f. kanehirae TaxID=337451 RepID=A0A443P4P6_9MAGN|nr:putative BOI-related E3 ubiquitin-protein ligase 3 [Cinnamomum micranthum f. kanehirae]
MAVEAHHLHLIPPQLIKNWETIQTSAQNANLCNTQMAFGIENLTPFYNCPIGDPFAALFTTKNTADSGLTCNLSAPQKRMREQNRGSAENDQSSTLSSHFPYSFLGEDFFLEVQRQQSEIDQFITRNMEKVRIDLAESHQRNKKRIFIAVEEEMKKRLKSKDEQIEKIERLNFMLQEKVKSLCVENQIWRNLAMSNEATANALRTNLDQVLALVSNEQRCELAEDADSCCDSSEGNEGVKDNKCRNCRNCWEEEACVLLLPCRHLCLCSKCGSKLNTCPVCKANKSGSVHVNIS